MKKEIVVPAMGESITEATIGELLKKSGSEVKADDEILELETDKVNQVIYAPTSGLLTLTVSKDQTVAIGDVIGYIEERNGQQKETKETPPQKEKAKEISPKEEKPIPPPKEKPPEKKTPPQSEETIRQSKEDYLNEPVPNKVQEDLKTSPSQPDEVSRKKMTKIRRVIAERLVAAKNNAAMLTTFNEVDLTEVMEMRKSHGDQFLEKFGVKLGFMSFFVKAAVQALRKYPEVNSFIEGDEIVTPLAFNIGIAVSTERGLMVPVLRHAEEMGFGDIEKEIASFAERARGGTLKADELQGGTFTITNGGVYGSLLSTPILNPPQSAILGMHKIQKRAVVVNDQIVIRSMMYLALSYDHRLIDGKEAVSFLIEIKNILEDPSKLILEI